jgi:hypothetical protein
MRAQVGEEHLDVGGLDTLGQRPILTDQPRQALRCPASRCHVAQQATVRRRSQPTRPARRRHRVHRRPAPHITAYSNMPAGRSDPPVHRRRRSTHEPAPEPDHPTRSPAVAPVVPATPTSRTRQPAPPRPSRSRLSSTEPAQTTPGHTRTHAPSHGENLRASRWTSHRLPTSTRPGVASQADERPVNPGHTHGHRAPPPRRSLHPPEPHRADPHTRQAASNAVEGRITGNI